MCGIAGLICDRPASAQAVAAMCALQAHRGPDDEGIWTSADGRVALGLRRLAIIDPTAAAHQPMVSADGRLVLVFNGEIYNYREIAAELEALGVRLRTHSDTEVLLEALARWGEAALDRLNGMFAFAAWNMAERTLTCARDRFGEKPFLYAQGRGFFALASEYKALFALAELPVDPDSTKLARFMCRPSTGTDDTAETVFHGIRQLLPGEMLILDANTMTVRTRRWWRPRADPADAALPEDEAAERFRALLTDSVRLRMRSDVSQGSCLSGGLDSTSIVCLARELIGPQAPYHVFTGRFPGTAADEGSFAEAAAAAAGATMHVVTPTPEGFVADLPSFVWHNELPVGSTSQYAQWCVFRLAREHGVTVLLDGQGADEMLGGYEQFFRIYLAELAAVRAVACMREARAIRERYPAALAGWRERLSRALPPGLRRAVARALRRGSDVAFGMTADAVRAAGDAGADEADARLTAAFERETFHQHLPVLLRYGDRNAMAHSREVRLPFCDHRIAEFALALPAGFHMGDAQTKRLLRRAMKGVLPEPIRTRWNKQGFLPPQALWLRGSLLPLLEATLQDPAFGREGLWEPGWWRSALSRFRAGDDALAATLWRPLIETAWRRHFVDRARGMTKTSVFA